MARNEFFSKREKRLMYVLSVVGLLSVAGFSYMVSSGLEKGRSVILAENLTRHMSLPSNVRPYDFDKNGYLDEKEQSALRDGTMSLDESLVK